MNIDMVHDSLSLFVIISSSSTLIWSCSLFQFQQQPGYGVPPQQQQPQQTHYQPQQRMQPSPAAPSPVYQPSVPPPQTQFYNPAAYQPQAPQPSPASQPSFHQAAPTQASYYNGPPQPSTTANQPSWSQPPPVSMYQPQPANTVPTQVPAAGQYGGQMQMKGQQPPVQIFNPGSSVTPGAPYSGSSPTGAPSVGPPPPGPAAPPPSGPPPTGMINSWLYFVREYGCT